MNKTELKRVEIQIDNITEGRAEDIRINLEGIIKQPLQIQPSPSIISVSLFFDGYNEQDTQDLETIFRAVAWVEDGYTVALRLAKADDEYAKNFDAITKDRKLTSFMAILTLIERG